MNIRPENPTNYWLHFSMQNNNNKIIITISTFSKGALQDNGYSLKKR